MKVIVLGADGYLGWATCMHLSLRGHSVLGVDNFSRRSSTSKLDRRPLVQMPGLPKRAEIWKALCGRDVQVEIGDVTDYNFLSRLVEVEAPDAIIHYAEQPSAPLSMMDHSWAAETARNNFMSTLNVVWAVKEKALKCHIIKLGTMGEYGTPNIDIEEGYLDVTYKGREHRFLYPKTPGSIYHLTKVQDSDLLYFATRVWGLAVTDLNQGPVYGIHTQEMQAGEELAPHFSYDDIFGTVINRFVVQAAAGHPLTIYGKGGQKRGYIDIRDTLQCVQLALRSPAACGEFRVLNQFTETYTINELAYKVIYAARWLGISANAGGVDNPRVEEEHHYYKPTNSKLISMGLEPHLLTAETLANMITYVLKHKKDINPNYFSPSVRWA